jgi:hypothetical protein
VNDSRIRCIAIVVSLTSSLRDGPGSAANAIIAGRSLSRLSR